MSRVILATVAGGDVYDRYATRLIESAHKYFKPADVVLCVKLVGVNSWPEGTLFRYHFLLNQLDWRDSDYVFMCDADMLFEGEVGDEVLPDRIVATKHPGYIGKPWSELPYDNNPKSKACVELFMKPTDYYAGGFIGGRGKDMRDMSRHIAHNIDVDWEKGIVARWHDESHLNRYLVDNPPDLVLDPSYCYPDNDRYYTEHVWKVGYQRKLVALDKTKDERGDR